MKQKKNQNDAFNFTYVGKRKDIKLYIKICHLKKCKYFEIIVQSH